MNKNGKKLYGDYSAVKQATPVLSKPTGLYAASIAENQIKLTWNAVDGNLGGGVVFAKVPDTL